MPEIWPRVDGRKPQEHRRRELYAHNCNGEEEVDASLTSSLAQTVRSTASGSALMMASDVRLSYSQGATSLIISVFGPTTSKRESAFEKAEVVVRLHSRVGVLAVQPLSAVGSAPEKRRFLEARHQQLQEVYAGVLLPLLQTSVESVLCLEQFPRCVIVVDVVVLAEDGGLFATVLNGVMCALLEAGLPCRSSFAAVTIAALTADESSSPREGSEKVSNSTDGKRKRGRDETQENNTSTTSLCFFVDPSGLEETLCGMPSKHESSSEGDEKKKSSVTAAKEAAIATTARGQLIKMQQECRTVAIGTFVMGYRPSGGSSAEARFPTIASHIQSGPGSARTSSSSDGKSSDAILLKPHEWLAMEKLACMCVTPVFDFYRKLNVPLEEP